MERKLFRHSEELLAAISVGQCSLNASALSGRLPSCGHLLGIYRQRVKHLHGFSTQHAITIREDCEALVRELGITPDEPCRIWIFKSEAQDFSVFEAIESRRILGCVRSVDKREVDDVTWRALWGE